MHDEILNSHRKGNYNIYAKVTTDVLQVPLYAYIAGTLL